VHICTAVLSLGIGMAVCGATFSAANALIFARIPGIADRESLVHVDWLDGPQHLTPREFDVLEAGVGDVVGLAAQGDALRSAQLPEGPSSTRVAYVSGGFFQQLGTVAVCGRLLNTSDTQPGASPVVVLGQDTWRRAYNSDGTVIGRVLAINRQAFTIVGVAPDGFPGLTMLDVGSDAGAVAQLWVPLRDGSPDRPWLEVAGRVRPGAPVAAVQAQLAALGSRAAAVSPVAHQSRRLRVFRAGLSWRDTPVDALLAVALVLVVPLCVLAIGCMNVVNLQLARATERSRELGIRITLGASRWRIARLLAGEVLVFTVIASVIGYGGARLLVRVCKGLVPVTLTPDNTVIVFFVVLGALVIGLGGVFPAMLASRQVLAAGLRDDPGSLPFRRLRSLLVALQVAGAVVLLFLTALGVRTLQTESPILPPGADRILVADLDLNAASESPWSRAAFAEAVLRQAREGEGIHGAALASFTLTGVPFAFRVAGDDPASRRLASAGSVTPSWFDIMSVRVLAGHPFDGSSPASEVVVNAAFASRLGRQDEVLGRAVIDASAPNAEPLRVVGVIGDTATAGVPMLYRRMPANPPAFLVLFTRAEDVAVAARTIREAIRRADPAVARDRIRSLDREAGLAFSGFEAVLWPTAVLGSLALALALVGLHAVLVYTVRRRTKEIGIRIAIGASGRSVVWLVLKQGLLLVSGGSLVGLTVAVATGQLMQAVFVGVSPVDPVVMLPTLLLLLVVGCASAVIPALRAIRITPHDALREE
jgi:predicted permease